MSTQVSRAGYIALAGLPNSGKSTLMNRLVGQKISIVTPKAQTTWQRITGIRTTDNEQGIFLDTPGLLLAKDLLQKGMLEESLEAISEADVVVLILDATNFSSNKDKDQIKEVLSLSSAPVFAAINKIDIANPRDITDIVGWIESELGVEARGISALMDRGVEELWVDLAKHLPESPFLYPPEDVASLSVRFFVAEFVRETIFEQFQDEIPYAVFVSVEDFRENQDPVYIKANVWVEKKSQKRILVGNQGKAIRELGRLSRGKIEEFIDCSVYLDLWVKVLPNWRKKPLSLRRLGLRVPVL
uniref:GTPase Era n=2 Tax=Bacteria TaxID=2 RepID=E7C4I5_9BACT|nr:GTPase [uncultured Gemmatimonadales bacterium HF0200_36I24]ADI22359.1 GTPase [uncultured nuHF2 cluster bacterium HF0500_02A10]